MPQPINQQNKPTTQYIDAQIPDGPAVWIAGFGRRGSAWRNHTNAMPIEQTPSYDDDLTGIDVPIFRNLDGAGHYAGGTFKKGKS